jgi:hypothetical protein
MMSVTNRTVLSPILSPIEMHSIGDSEVLCRKAFWALLGSVTNRTNRNRGKCERGKKRKVSERIGMRAACSDTVFAIPQPPLKKNADSIGSIGDRPIFLSIISALAVTNRLISIGDKRHSIGDKRHFYW